MATQLCEMTVLLSQDTLTDFLSVLTVSGLPAVHGDIFAIKEAQEECEKAQTCGGDIRQKPSLR